jgi:Zn-dependent protease
MFFYLFYMLNVSLGVFNLLPVPPLDGSRIFLSFLPPKLYFQVMWYEHIIQMVLMLGLWLGFLDRPLRAVVSFVMSGMEWLVGLIPIF